jgi:hypothetical protein
MPTVAPRGLCAVRALAASLLAALLVACGGPAAPPTAAPSPIVPTLAPTAPPATAVLPTAPPTAAATPAPPTPTPAPASPTPVPPQAITITSPPPGTLVGSPVVITGVTQRLPLNGKLSYAIAGPDGKQIGAGAFPVAAAGDGSGAFTASLTFDLPQNGGGITVTIFEPGQAPGTNTATASLPLVVAAQIQKITITSPPPGTQVGSPVTVTGSTAKMPFNGRLNYRVVNSANQQIGGGDFPVAPQADGSGLFTASLTFNVPLNGDNIQLQLFDRDPANGQVVASATLAAVVAATPQQITLDSPPNGAFVGSPMTLSGRTTRFPFNGQLSYRVTQNGQQLGAGRFPVVGQSGQPTTFNAQATFAIPQNGGSIVLEVFDQNPQNGAVVATTSVTLQVLAQVQGIVIDTPPPGTLVGSPVVVTGRLNQFPPNGRVTYRVLDASNQPIGAGDFPASGNPDQTATFNASLTFTPPSAGGAIRIELLAPSATGGQPGRASINLTVAPQTPTITIETPPAGTLVGSPVVVTGRISYRPQNDQVLFRVLDANGQQIGAGQFPISLNPGQQSDFGFVGSLRFQEPPGGRNITVVLQAPSPIAGAPPVQAQVTLFVAPARQPRGP